MVEELQKGLYRITVALPDSPLRSLNSYVIQGKERNLLIDTGFNRSECLQELRAGIEELGLDMEATDIFVTHVHADHSGLVSQIATSNSRIYMHEKDKEMLDLTIDNPGDFWKPLEVLYQSEGYPVEELKRTRCANPARNFVSGSKFDYIPITGDMELLSDYGQLQCILTPGHTPGHTCLYDKERKVFFSGDHILFDITPNITTWESMPDALAKYLESLRKIYDLSVDMTLTGHRENQGDFRFRITELLKHHAKRLNEMVEIIKQCPGISGYEVAGKMEWSIRAKNWEEFPPVQRWFAVGEAISHLNYLVLKGKIKRQYTNGVSSYVCL